MDRIKRQKMVKVPRGCSAVADVTLKDNGDGMKLSTSDGWPNLLSQDDFLIDRAFLLRYPLETHSDQYSRTCSVTKSLILSGMSRFQMMEIFKFNPNLSKLTLIRINSLDGCPGGFPSHLNSLKLADIEVNKTTLYSMLDLVKDSLKVLHLDRIRCDDGLQSRATASVRFQAVLCNVRDLTLERMDMRQCAFLSRLKNLESLALIEATGCIEMPHNANSLRRLRIELGRDGSVYTPRNNYYNLSAVESFVVRGQNPNRIWKLFEFGPALKSFECHDAPHGKDFDAWKHLQHVKLFCGPHDMEKLRQHFAGLKDIKSYELTCCAPSPGYNLMETLNEDCLRKIVSYLDKKDLYNLTLVHSDFVFYRPTTLIRPEFVRVYRPTENAELYKKIGAHATELVVESGGPFAKHDLKEEDFYHFIGHFKKLQKLSLKSLVLYDSNRVTEIPLVNELRLQVPWECGDDSDADVAKAAEYWSALLRHLNPKLTRIRLDGEVTKLKPLKWLTNIEFAYFDLSELSGSEYLARFFRQNPKLSHLEINRRTYYPGWDAIRPGLEAINRETLRSLTFVSDIDGFAMGVDQARFLRRFKNLVHFGVKQHTDCMEEDLSKPTTLSDRELWGTDEVFATYFHMLPKLKMLTMEYCDDQAPGWLFERLLGPALERLAKERPIKQEVKEQSFKAVLLAKTTK